jgi:hypothetical protein
MENPNSWTETTKVINKCLEEWAADINFNWLSLAAYIENKLRVEGLLKEDLIIPVLQKRD